MSQIWAQEVAAFASAEFSPFPERQIEIDQHHDTGFRGDTGQRDEPDGDGDAEIVVEPPHEPNAANKGERHGRHDNQRLGQPPKIENEQHQDDYQHCRYHDLELGVGPLQVFELTTPLDVVPRWQLDLLAHRACCVGDIPAEIAALEIDIDVSDELRVLRADAGWSLGDANARHLPKRHHGAAHGRHEHVAGDCLRIVAQITRVANDDAVALAPLNRGGDRFATQRRSNHLLHVVDAHPVARCGDTIWLDLNIASPFEPLCEGTRRARDTMDHALDLGGQSPEFMQVRAKDLHANRGADARREHIDPRLDRHRPGVADTGDLKCFVHVGDQPIDRHSRTPFALGLEVDNGLAHLDRRRIGRCHRAPGLAEHRCDLWKGLDDPVLCLQQLGGLRHGQTGKCHRHE